MVAWEGTAFKRTVRNFQVDTKRKRALGEEITKQEAGGTHFSGKSQHNGGWDAHAKRREETSNQRMRLDFNFGSLWPLVEVHGHL